MESAEAHEEFIRDHWNDIYKTQKSVKEPDFVRADEMIAAARRDPSIARLIKLPGESEVIMTGVMFGSVPWKIRLDKYVTDPLRMIVDWKTVANIQETMWDETRHEHVSFVRYWGYDRRAAVYLEIEKQNSSEESDALFPLVCISKQSPPGKDIFLMNSRDELDAALGRMEAKALHFQAVKEGREEARRCEECAYCRSTKRIREPRLFTVLDPGNRESV
jgi:hypothetical protein